MLYEPSPNINKVLSLILQEEKQRSIKNGDFSRAITTHPIEATTFYSDARSGLKHSGKGNSKREGPIYTHYGKSGHIVEKCYKLHGFPPRFEFRNKSIANQVTHNQVPGFGNVNHAQNCEDSSLSFPQFPISKSQCKQPLAFLNSRSIGDTQHSTPQQSASLPTTSTSTS